MKFAIVLGTRPEIIKLSPIIRYFQNNNLDYFIIHTNQHYSDDMDKIFFNELDLCSPKYNLNVGSGTHGKQTAMMLEKIDEVLLLEIPDYVFVQVDTNSVLAGALAASKLGVKIIHIESGLRSYDRSMPEEINRILVDSISNVLQVPTLNQKKILLSEGIKEESMIVSGNTIVDAVNQNLDIAYSKSKILDQMKIVNNSYFLLTLHRPSNVDSKEDLERIFNAIIEVNLKYKKEIIFPCHPRTLKNINLFNISLPYCIKLITPVGYLDMLSLISNAELVLTDSGGIQEEACILKVPSITLRENTERPETIEVGASILTGNDKHKIINGCDLMLSSNRSWINPFGEGKITEKIMGEILYEKKFI